MAESFNTLAHLVYLNDANLNDLGMSDLLDECPALSALFAQTASNGTLHNYVKQTTASSAAFRAAGAGLTKTPSADTKVTDTLKILDASFCADVALADAYHKGRDAYMERELKRALKQSFAEVEAQIFNGVNNDGSGFIGLNDDGQLNAISDAMVIAADTAGSTGSSQTSVYLVRSDETDVSMVIGNAGKIVVDDDPVIIEKVVNPGTDNATFPALYCPVTGYVGFQIGGAYSAARIVNVETALTDDDIYEGLALFPSGKMPNFIFMNRKSMRLLRQSRTAVNATGAAAPFVHEIEGIPVIMTDGVLNTEAVVS